MISSVFIPVRCLENKIQTSTEYEISLMEMQPLVSFKICRRM